MMNESDPEPDTNNDIQEETLPPAFNRGVLLNKSLDVLHYLESRITVNRFRTREGDNEYLHFIRAYANLLTAINKIAGDIELDEMQAEIEALKEQRN